MNPTEKTSFLRDYRVYVTYLSVFILELTYGVIVSWTSPMIVKLKGTDDNPLGRALTVNESSWMASIAVIGTMVGSLIYGALAQRFGRKTLIASLGLPYIFFFVAMPYAKQLWIYYIVRLLAGVSDGGVLTLVPMYVGELAKPEIRGKLFVLNLIAADLGIVLTYSTAPFMSFFWYHICSAILPILFLIIFSIFAFESPYYTIQRDPAKAEEILKQLRGKDDVSEEINRIKIRQQKTLGMSLVDVLKTRSTRKALLISVGVVTFLMLSGITIVTTYAQNIFESAGGAWSSEANSIIISVFKVFSTVLSSTLTDRFGRKSLLIISIAAASFSQGILSCYLILKDSGTYTNSAMNWIPILSLMGFVASTSFMGIAPSVLGELFCMRAKSVGMTVNTVYGGFLGFLATFLFQKAELAIGLGHTFLIFTGFGVCALIFIITFMIETKGKSLEQIQDELDDMKEKKYYGKV